MDAADLARWTRFAAKGGIGKCIAIQDCIAESPEDLMFLKDDEITVLMQLNGQPGRYLGYCEGVVGRFQGEHVHFHAKLKRPVLTKRASSTAVSATSSPAPSVTPSPRMPLAPLANPNNGNAKPLDRDSAVLTDPFDLELDAPPKARRSEDAGSQSDDNNVSRQRLTRGGDDLPGLEMFLPRSRSGSRSRPSSRGLGDDDKSVKLRTRILAPQQLQNASPQVNSLELPPSSPVKPPPSSSSESRLQRSSPESDKPEVEISVDEIVPRSVTSPEPMGEESVPDKDVSSLYDGASMRSSFYSTHSYRSSVFGAGSGLNAGGLNALGRLSQAESDDGELGMGIGLSMLQDMGDDDDDDSGTGEAVPPTPRPDKPREEDEQNMDVKDGMSGDLRDEREDDEDEDDDDDDDGSYWDGADIYDNYRYSRYSVMTKNSRRKSRFSMISRNSVADPEPHDLPPIPLDAEGRLRSDSTLSSPVSASQGEHERRKHVPPPLTLVKSTPGTSSMDPSLLSVGPATLSPSTSRRSTSEFSAGGSPLLHTNFASPRTSSSRATSFGTDSAETPAQSPEPNSVSFTGAGASASVSGVASALRQRLENERSGTPTPLPSPLPVNGEQRNTDEKQECSEGHGGEIVVEDDEPVSVTVIPADEGGPSKDNHIINDHAKESAPRDSVQSAISSASVASTASFETDVSDVSGVMRKIEADLAMSATAPSGSTPPLNLRSPSLDKDGQRTPNSTTFPASPTQPLRLQERSPSRMAPAPSSLPSPDPRLQQIPSKQREGDLPNPHYARSAPTPPSGSQLLRPEQALFLPHPNAPRPNPAVLSGQRTSTYGMPPVHEPRLQAAQSPQVGVGDGANSLEAVLRAASASRIGPAGILHRPTIFGKPIIDLASADGPVAMVWSLSPFPPEPVSRAGSPAAGTRVPRRSTTAGASPLSQNVRLASTSPSPAPSNHASPINTPAPLPSPVKPSAQTPPPPQSSINPSFSGASSNAIPRANFSPRVGAPRPRSRSFSGFGREVPTKPEPNERAREEGSRPTRVASMQSLKEGARVAGNASPPNGHPLRQTSVAAAPSKTTHAPSPLSRPENNAVIGSPRTASLSKGIPSPLGRSFFSPSQLEPPDRAKAASDAETSNPRQLIPLVGRNTGVRQVASVDVLRTERKESPLVSPPRSVLQPVRRNSGPAEGSASLVNATAQSATSPVMTCSSISSSPIQRLRRISSPSSKRHQRSTSQQSQNSNNSDPRSVVISPPPVNGNSSGASSLQRSNSGKSKISLSHLRIRSSTAKESLDVQTPSPSTGPATPIFDFDSQPQTVQVQDAEFEMIRPTMRRVSSEPVSDDSVLGQDERPSFQQDSGGDSPVGGSVRSVLSPTQSTVAESVRDRTTRLGKAPDDASTHNARELKWISTMSAVPAAQARKNKKIRRLVLEGVPSSVRYLVWGHLTDSKAKRIPGVYGQLGKRGRVAATEAIERDAGRCFPDQPHLQDPKGPLVGLLQTYLTMVPDIEYQTSLCLVAGHLLLQSPEEDAFWTFTSMMDLHLRAYFSSRSVQMEADAMVFGKTVEVLNPFLAKELFVDLALHPLEICRMWFASLFATNLPQDYVNRIWDVYLCEGPPFLFRIALTILSCCRNAIEESRDRTAVFAFLSRPETLSLLPDDPEEFINMALSVKVKDDDIKKQRAKVESHLRQQTQSAQRNAAPRLVSSISLPRAPGAVATSL